MGGSKINQKMDAIWDAIWGSKLEGPAEGPVEGLVELVVFSRENLEHAVHPKAEADGGSEGIAPAAGPLSYSD